ncbi:MAG: ABC transporter permease [Bacteroidales bacterium]|jgi:peptide/nickel transport system permease protein|nr:ABC transporter permease [Bacteroidales bacterium]
MGNKGKSEYIRKLYEQQSTLDQSIARQMMNSERLAFATSQWRMMWRKFVKNRIAVLGGIVVLLFYLIALFADFIAPYTLQQRMDQYSFLPPQKIHFFYEGKLQPFVYSLEGTRDPETLMKVYIPDHEKQIPVRFFVQGESYKLMGLFPASIHLFGTEEGIVSVMGTDGQGRDMFSRIIIGSQISLTIGLAGVALSLLIGAFLGVYSGYFGGWIDNLIQRMIEIIRSFPPIPLWMALTAALPSHWPPLKVYFAITVILSLIGWTWLARQLRGKVLALREEDFVLAARLSGASNWWIITKHLIPATMSHIIVISTLSMPSMILAESSLSFLGLGLRPPLTSWGVLLQQAQNIQVLLLYPWLMMPGFFVAISILAFNFLGDGLRDAADPYTV